MRYPPIIDEARVRVWVAFAEHFLDTETRHELPRAALAAVEAGFSIEEAREIWRHEVTPVVGPNLWSVAGTWAGWPDDWLVERCSAVARRRTRPPALVAYLRYRLAAHLGHGSWRSIEALMHVFLTATPSRRRALADDLVLLGRCWLDLAEPGVAALDRARRDELRSLCRAVLMPALRPSMVAGESPRELEQRIAAALR